MVCGIPWQHVTEKMRTDLLTEFLRSGDAQPQQTNSQEAHDELMNLMTIMYISVQETLNDPDDMSSVYGKLRKYRSILAPTCIT